MPAAPAPRFRRGRRWPAHGGHDVAVVPSGTFTAASTKFTIITATGGVSGTFGSITGGTALLTPVLSYDANDAFVTLTQFNVATATTAAQMPIAGFVETANEFAAATAFDAGRAANAAAFQPALSALHDQLNAAGVTSSLDRLDGENNADSSPPLP